MLTERTDLTAVPLDLRQLPRSDARGKKSSKSCLKIYIRDLICVLSKLKNIATGLMDSITVRLESDYNYKGTRWVSVAALKTHLRQSNPGCGFLFVSAAASFQTKCKPTVSPHLFWADRYKSWKIIISPCPGFFMSSLKKGCQIPILCFITWAGKPYSRSEGQSFFTVFVFLFTASFVWGSLWIYEV